jgi:hypothetical protein
MPQTPRNKISCPAAVTVERALNTLLEGVYPHPEGLAQIGPGVAHTRRQDDCDGESGMEHDLSVGFSRDGDAWVIVAGMSMLRFRTDAGGGMSLRVHNALIVLAEAIRRDNEQRPQRA